MALARTPVPLLSVDSEIDLVSAGVTIWPLADKPAVSQRPGGVGREYWD